MSGSKGLQVNMGEEIEKALIYSLTRDARADNVRLLDAALRRAKAEGLDDAAKAICMYCNDPEWQKRDEDDNHESPYTRTMYPCAAYKIHDLIRKLDACAAQIEEGE